MFIKGRWTKVQKEAKESKDLQNTSTDIIFEEYMNLTTTPVSYTHLDVYKRQPVDELLFKIRKYFIKVFNTVTVIINIKIIIFL